MGPPVNVISNGKQPILVKKGVHYLEPQEGTDVILKFQFPAPYPTTVNVTRDGAHSQLGLTPKGGGEFVFTLRRVASNHNGFYRVKSNNKKLEIQIKVDDKLDRTMIADIMKSKVIDLYRRVRPDPTLIGKLKRRGVIDEWIEQQCETNITAMEKTKIILDHIKAGAKQVFIDFCLVLHESDKSDLVTGTMGIAIEKLLTHSERVVFGKCDKVEFEEMPGAKITLKVELWGRGPQSVEWYHNNKQIQVPSTSTRTAELTLPCLSPADAGQYQVKLQDENHFFRVNVKNKPTIQRMMDASIICAQSGTDCSLKVKVTGYPAPTFTLTNNGKQLETFTTDTTPDGTTHLAMKDVRINDSGNYVFRATNDQGTDVVSFTVEVYEKPRFLEYDSKVNHERGKPLRIEIPLEGYPAPIIAWTHNGGPIDPALTKKRGHHVCITKDAVTEVDDGTYCVTAANKYGTAKTTFQLKTIVKPGLILLSQATKVKVNFGSKFELKVKKSGRPEPTVTFRRDGHVVNAKNITREGDILCLSVNNATYADSGTYLIEADNEEASTSVEVSVDVGGKPVLTTKSTSPIRVEHGGSIHLNVQVVGNPEPKCQVTHNGMLQDKDLYTFDNGQMTFEKKGVGFSDAGTIALNAENKHGERKVSFLIEVYGKPVIKLATASRRFDVPESGSLQLPISIQGQYKTVTWYFNDIRIHQDLVATTEKQSVLSLRHASKQQAGKYRVTVANKYGSDSKTFQVHIVDRPVLYALTDTKPHVTLGSNLELKVMYDGIPKPKVHWERNGKELPAERSERQTTLRLQNIKDEADGDYTVVARSKKGKTSLTFSVAVQVSYIDRIKTMPGQLKRALEGMVGREKEKEELVKMYKFGHCDRQLRIEGKNTQKKVPVILLTGNPGTGKSEFAAILAELMHDAGMVRSRKLKVVHRADLVARHMGETTVQANEVVHDASDGTLLVENAHELIKPGQNDYGHEALTVIMNSVEGGAATRSDRPAIIFTGEYQLLYAYFATQHGLLRRLTHSFHLDDYTIEDITKILIQKAEVAGYHFGKGIDMKKYMKRAFPPGNLQLWNAGICDKILYECQSICKGRMYDSIKRGNAADRSIIITSRDLKDACRKVFPSILERETEMEGGFGNMDESDSESEPEEKDEEYEEEEEEDEQTEGEEESCTEDRQRAEASATPDKKVIQTTPADCLPATDAHEATKKDTWDVSQAELEETSKEIKTPGVGDAVREGSFVTVDITWPQQKRMTKKFQLGREVFGKAVDQAVSSMRLGETSVFKTKPNDSKEGMESMSLHLKYWTTREDLFEFSTATEKEQEVVGWEIVAAFAESLLRDGNLYYNNKRFDEAFRSYFQAVDYMDKTCAKDDESKQKHHGILAKLYKNSSLAARQLKNTKMADAIATENAAKEFYLQGKTLWSLEKKDEAKTAFKEAKELHPRYRENNIALRDIEREMQDDGAKALEMIRSLLNK